MKGILYRLAPGVLILAAIPALQTASAPEILPLAEQRLYELVNERRQQARLPPLLPEETLRTVARAHASDMLERDFFEHINPDGQNSADRIARMHRTLIGKTGENLWKGSRLQLDKHPDLGAEIFRILMASGRHRTQIVHPDYTHIGIGVIFRDGEARAAQSFAHVAGYLAQPLPATVPQRARLDLSLETPEQADRFDLVRPGASSPSFGPTTDPRLHTDPGSYRLRLYFRRGAQWTIFYGPQFAVGPAVNP